MEKFVKDEILKKMDELVLILKNDSDYLRYQEVTKQMKNNEEVMLIINKIKKLQKQLVNLEHFSKDVSDVESELSLSLKELESYPIYQEYSYLLDDLNNTFQTVKNVLEIHINNIVK